MIVHPVEQRTSDWTALRLGKVTGSVASDMRARRTRDGKPTKQEAAGRRNLRVRLVLERLTGRSHESGYQSWAMTRGVEREPEALRAYEAVTGRLVRRVGFAEHDDLMAGYSPDGVVGKFTGIVEAKCPIPATHLEYLKTGNVPGDYAAQILHGLFITGAEWCDFLSWNPDFPEGLQTKLVRVERDEAAIRDYEADLRAFLAEVDRELEALSTMTNLRATLERASA